MLKKIENISFIGSGAMASFLGLCLYNSGYSINQVWSRRLANSTRLADLIEAVPIDDIDEIRATDLIVIAIVDDAIESMIQNLPSEVKSNSLIVHTSGVSPISLFEGNVKSYGLFYPLNTFSIGNQPDSSETPFYLNADSVENLNLLTKVAEKLSTHVYQISEIQRKKLHLAAVFAANFSNACYQIAEMILEEENMELSHLYSLIRQTAGKVTSGLSPESAQTGPAIRNDVDTINDHLELIEDDKMREVYRLMSIYINKNLEI